LPVVKLLLQQQASDEICGFQKFVEMPQRKSERKEKDQVYKLTHLLPSWFPTTPSIIFLDELDKAREENTSAVLTFLRNGEIGQYKLPCGSVIIAAMNEIEELDEPLKARCCFLPFLPERRQADTLYEFTAKMPTLPDQVGNKENRKVLEYLLQYDYSFIESPHLDLILRGLFPTSLVPRIKQIVQELWTQTPDYRKLLDRPELFRRFIATLKNPKEVPQHFWGFYKVGRTKADGILLAEILRQFANDTMELFHSVCGEIYDWAHQHPDEVINLVVPKEFGEGYGEAAQNIYQELLNRIEENKKKAEGGAR
jgi:hypothetical protein